jgi:hypothetical protein
MGFLLGFLSLSAIAYKIKQTRGRNEFTEKLLLLFYTGMFWTGFNTLFYHPYYTNVITIVAALPMLASHLYFALFLIRKYGIGREDQL